VASDEVATIAIQLRRLAAPLKESDLPSYAEVGLVPLVEEATNWQLVRGEGWLWSAAALASDSPERWAEIAGLFGSTGESVVGRQNEI
jgi:hypothetical protein